MFPSPPWETHVSLVVCRVAVSISSMARWPSRRAPSVGTQLNMCALMSSIVPIAPMGKLLMCLPRLTLAQLRTLRSTIQLVRATETLKISHPMGDSRFACCLQGGGVFVGDGSVTIDSCTISGNAAVRAHVQKFASPRWENG